QLAEGAADARDARVALVHGDACSLPLRADDHRAQLEELEVGAVLADPRLPVEDGAAVLELDRERGEPEERRGRDERGARERDVRGAVHRVPSAGSHVTGTPRLV